MRGMNCRAYLPEVYYPDLPIIYVLPLFWYPTLARATIHWSGGRKL
jgi:hypothetical protein